MKPTTLFAPVALVAAGFLATPSLAHDRAEVQATVALPPIVLSSGGVVVSIGTPPPPPPVIVTAPPPPEQVVIVRPRREVIYTPVERDTRVVYVEDDDCHDHHRGRGHAWGKHKHGQHNTHGKHGKHRSERERREHHAQVAVYRR